jgi:NAD(P)H-dependent flavin oxidoreductase YrpB (nitropropane dioxygenase family)
MNIIEKLKISGEYVYPIIEGGKGIGVSDGVTAGSFAQAGAVGTISGVFPNMLNEVGKVIFPQFIGKTRLDRFNELVEQCITGCLDQIDIANKISDGNGRIHLNILWGMAGAERILNDVLESAKDKIHGITCGAGMPYKLANVAEKYKVYYYPIVSSARSFRALWLRSYKKFPDFLGGVVYEDPWRAGGHTGITQKENPHVFEDSFPRVKELRNFMNKVGLNKTPIVMAGGVWYLNKFKDWIDNVDIGPIAFQFGTRPMLTKESPISTAWKEKLLKLKREDVELNKFSPTGFFSSALNNSFLKELKDRASRQIAFRLNKDETFDTEYPETKSAKSSFIESSNLDKVKQWFNNGFTKFVKTPDSTFLFLKPEKAKQIRDDQKNCKGCLAMCGFSSWLERSENNYTTGEIADPRSYCIQKTLQNVILDNDIENQLMFAGSNAFEFSNDPLFNKAEFPSIKELIQQILLGK